MHSSNTRLSEKLYEELLMSEEGLQTTAHNKIFIGKPSDITYEQMLKKLGKLEEIKKAEEIVKLEEEVINKEKELHVINNFQTSYEKMNLDKILFSLNIFYKKNLEVVNEAILKAIEKFKEVGVVLMPKYTGNVRT